MKVRLGVMAQIDVTTGLMVNVKPSAQQSLQQFSASDPRKSGHASRLVGGGGADLMLLELS
jgi:hypothetical protein